jgi:RND family efflux transporter MFP subunit
VRRTVTTLLFLALLSALAWGIYQRLQQDADASRGATISTGPAPVEVVDVRTGSITLRRTFSGTLEAAAEFLLAPKISGRLERVEVDLGDEVTRGQIVAYLDDAEYIQAVHQVGADLDVARAGHAEAQSALEIAERALDRAMVLRDERVTSESQLDDAKTEAVARRARVEVTAANVVRAEAVLESARIRLGYAEVTADWVAGDDSRVVAQRFVDEGEAVSPGAPLLSIVELNPIVCVVQVPERDYAQLRVGRPAILMTDAYPGETFDAQVSRVAPVFRSSTRQARVELAVQNADERLKPGMFVRVTLEFATTEGATIVPVLALTERGGERGVFAVDEGAAAVRWVPVEVGIIDGTEAAVTAEGLSGRVVTLGQELCEDGTPVNAVKHSEPDAERHE